MFDLLISVALGHGCYIVVLFNFNGFTCYDNMYWLRLFTVIIKGLA